MQFYSSKLFITTYTKKAKHPWLIDRLSSQKKKKKKKQQVKCQVSTVTADGSMCRVCEGVWTKAGTSTYSACAGLSRASLIVVDTVAPGRGWGSRESRVYVSLISGHVSCHPEAITATYFVSREGGRYKDDRPVKPGKQRETEAGKWAD